MDKQLHNIAVGCNNSYMSELLGHGKILVTLARRLLLLSYFLCDYGMCKTLYLQVKEAHSRQRRIEINDQIKISTIIYEYTTWPHSWTTVHVALEYKVNTIKAYIHV